MKYYSPIKKIVKNKRKKKKIQSLFAMNVDNDDNNDDDIFQAINFDNDSSADELIPSLEHRIEDNIKIANNTLIIDNNHQKPIKIYSRTPIKRRRIVSSLQKKKKKKSKLITIAKKKKKKKNQDPFDLLLTENDKKNQNSTKR